MTPKLDCIRTDAPAAERPAAAEAVQASVWDLDHTLVATDTFAEQTAVAVLHRPWLLFPMVMWLLRGRGFCKGRVAAMVATPPEAWPVRPEALERIAADRADGRSIVLATAAHRTVAEPLAKKLGCFDAVLASDDRDNLKAGRKAAAIARMASEQGWNGFSYAGDCVADVPVWQMASEIIVVNPTPRLHARLVRAGKPLTVLGETASGWSAVVKALRPHQWAKNLLLFLPMVLAHRLDWAAACLASIAFVAFSLCASGIYVLNDIADVAADRQHARKRLRPFASGRLTIAAGMRLAVALFAAGLGLAAVLLPLPFLGLLAVYIAANLLYFSRVKQVPVLDVLMLASMYALRLEAGAVAVGAPLSDWFLTFSLFFFMSLAFAKRFVELARLQAAGGLFAAGRGYEVGDLRVLEMLGAASGYVSVLVLALYMNSEQMRALYKDNRLLWLICPLVLYWITRLWLLANRGRIDDDPVVFALRDRTSLAIGASCGVILLAAGVLARMAT